MGLGWQLVMLGDLTPQRRGKQQMVHDIVLLWLLGAGGSHLHYLLFVNNFALLTLQ